MPEQAGKTLCIGACCFIASLGHSCKSLPSSYDFNFQGKQEKARSRLLKPKYLTHQVSVHQQQRQQDTPRGCPLTDRLGCHGTGFCRGNSFKEIFAACMICHTGDYIGGKKAFLPPPPPPQWVFLPPCASLEINFQHLAAFSHDSPRLPWPGASPGTTPPPKTAASD